jgi:LysR family transcriptional regulator, nod-box dependent transcriptional activator
MRFKGLDLNLLAAFHALMETRSVSRSAEQLNLSQPAMSAALSRLREFFGDPILIAKNKRMYPTAYAEALLPRVQEALQSVEGIIATSASFHPATTDRTFRIAASDYIVVTVLAPLVANLAVSAPGVKIDIAAPDERVIVSLTAGKLDVIITPEHFVSRDHPTELLFEERHVVAGWAENPLLANRTITERAFFAAGHVAVAIGPERAPSFGDRHLATLTTSRRIEVTASSFAEVPWLLLGTPRLALMHERLAKVICDVLPLKTIPAPPFLHLPLMREMVQFNEVRRGDEGLSWLLRQLRSACAA